MSRPIPPPPSPPMMQDVEPKQGRGCFFYGCLTSIILLILLLAVVGGTIYWGYNKLLSYTSDKPMDIPTVEATADEYTALKARVEAFTKAIDEGKSAEIELSARDINILIAQDPDWKEVKGKAFVKIEGDEVKADASIPLGEFPGFKGRYLNGTIGLNISLENNLLVVKPKTVVVKGKALPKQVMDALREQNLAKDADKEEKNIEIIRKFERIEIKDGKIKVKSKGKK
ncbi:MAG: hypothetical protein GXP25_16740 [Planctomycetes bacterium]|nr:hypothetical protein [Planctomycetota bacterium]